MLVPMVIAAVMLGKSFDLDSMQPGKEVFKKDEIDSNKLLIETPFTRSEYKLVESSSDTSDVLKVNGELSLKVKGGKLQIDGSGDYLQSKIDRTKTVELLMSVYTEQFVETFPTYVSQEDDWPTGITGTHYIRGFVYGAQLIISYKMQVDNSEYREDVLGAVKAHLETSGSLNADIKGKLEKIHKVVSGKCRIDIHTYATCPPDLFVQPQDLEGVFNLTDSFPSIIKNLTEPIKVRIELEPLSTLNPGFPSFKRDVINEIINDAIDKYDDMRLAIADKDSWEPPDNMTEELIQRLNDFDANLTVAYKAMQTAIGNLNSSQPFDPNHFKEAFELYAWGGYNLPNRFTIEFSRIKNDAKNYTPPWYPYTRAVNQFIHWGQINCSLPSPDPILVGLAVSSPKGFGNGADLQCMKLDPRLGTVNLTADMIKSGINGLTYQLPSGETVQLVCARCLLENATSVITVPAKRNCPENTKLEYEGFMATGFDAVTDPICVDKAPLEHLPGVLTNWADDNVVNVIKPVWIRCPDCENPDNYVPCVVCSR